MKRRVWPVVVVAEGRSHSVDVCELRCQISSVHISRHSLNVTTRPWQVLAGLLVISVHTLSRRTLNMSTGYMYSYGLRMRATHAGYSYAPDRAC